MSPPSARKAAPLPPEDRNQVRLWLDRERDRALRAADRVALDAGELLRRKQERDPCAYLSATAAQEDAELTRQNDRASANRQHIREIEEALRRLEDEPEQFGMCDLCGRSISMERLEVIPYTRACGHCASSGEA